MKWINNYDINHQGKTIKALLITLIFTFGLLADSYPTIFAQLGDPLFRSAQQLQQLSEVKSLNKPIQDYTAFVSKTKEYGFKIEKSTHKEKKKKYLKQLRILQKKYDTLTLFLQKRLSQAIVEDDYRLFSIMIGSDASLFFEKKKLKENIYTYYKKQQHKGVISSLQQRIKKDSKIIEVYSPTPQHYSNYTNQPKRKQHHTTRNSVTVLSTPSCPYCRKAKRFLRAQGIAFRDYNINSSSEGKRLYRQYNGSGVPVVIINTKVIHGYSEAQMRAALR
jgi:glutaredoxin